MNDAMTSRHDTLTAGRAAVRAPFLMALMAAILCGLVGGVPHAAAQAKPSPARTPADDRIALDPIKCWWRSASMAVVVGERFVVTLTCGIVETSAVKTALNRDNLEPAALTLTPFEVVGGVRREDVVTGPWRYFQYEYTLRLVGDEFFDREVPIPALGITYHVVATATETQEREHTYTLPPLPMKVVSLVPKQATGMREAPPEPFASIEARRFRSTAELIAAAVSSGFAVLLFGVAIARTVGRYREQRPQEAATITTGSALRGSLRAVAQLKRDVARDGWTPETAARALAPLRLAGAVAVGRPVAQSVAAAATPLREGQVAVRSGWIRRRRVVASGAASTATVARSLAAPGAGVPSPSRDAAELEAIAESLRVFSAARYGRSATLDTTALESALGQAESAIRRLSYKSLWPFRPRTTAAGAARGPAWFR